MSAASEVWHTPGLASFDTEYSGIDAVLGYLKKLVELTDGTFKTEPESMAADDSHVRVVEHVTGTRRGRTLVTRVFHVYEVHDETTEYAAEPKKLEEFWARI